MGLGLFLVPEAARRTHLREHASGILARTLALIAAVAIPMVLVYAVAAKPLLQDAVRLLVGMVGRARERR